MTLPPADPQASASDKEAPPFAPVAIVVDATSYLFMAHYAGPDLVGHAARPLGALQQLHDTLRALGAQHPGATQRICIFEAGVPSGALTSDSALAAFHAQVGPARTLVALLGWHVNEAPAAGAVDAIATVCRGGVATLVVGTRKRLAQLVSDTVQWHEPLTPRRYDTAAVRTQFGVEPELVPDYLALVGDVADGFEGVPRYGPKRARAALCEFGSAQALVDNAHALRGTDFEELQHHVGPIATRLVRLRASAGDTQSATIEAPVSLVPADPAALDAFANELGLAVAPSTARSEKPGAATAVEWIRDEAALLELCGKLAGRAVGLALATDAQPPTRARLVGVALSHTAGQGAYIPVAHPDGTEQLAVGTVLRILRSWLQDPAQTKVIYQARLAMHVFENHGVGLSGISADPYLQMHLLLGDEPLSLSEAARRFLRRDKIRADADAGIKPDATGSAAASDVVGSSLAEAADVTRQLAQVLARKLSALPALDEFHDIIELPVAGAVKDIERLGMLVDRSKLRELAQEYEQTRQLLKAQAWSDSGIKFDLDNQDELASVMYDRLRLPLPTTSSKKSKKGGAAKRPTDRATLHALSEHSSIPQLVTEYLHLGDLLAYARQRLPHAIDPATGRIHTRFGLARTGRITSKNPALHNIPVRTPQGKRIREAFVAPRGSVIVDADYSQIELRILAHFSADPVLCAAFAEGIDVHSTTAAELFGVHIDTVSDEQRRFAKAINFSLINGKHARTLAHETNVPLAEAQSFIDRYFTRFRAVKDYIAHIQDSARTHGYVETLHGRRIAIPGIRHHDYATRSHAKRQAVNAPMQGSVADIIKIAMLALRSWIDHNMLGTRILMQVHDELLLETPIDELPTVLDNVPRLMQTDTSLRVPLVIGIGHGLSWAEAH